MQALYVVSVEMLRIIQFNLIIWGAVYVSMIFDERYSTTFDVTLPTARLLLNVNIGVTLVLLCINIEKYVYVYGMTNTKANFIKFAVDIACLVISILLIVNKIFVVKNFFHHFVMTCIILILLQYASKKFADAKASKQMENMRCH